MPFNDVPKGLSVVALKDVVREAVLGPGLPESLRAQMCWALGTPRSPASEEPPLGTEVRTGVLPPRRLSQVQTVHLHHPFRPRAAMLCLVGTLQPQ